MQLLLPMTGLGANNSSMASIKLSSADSLPVAKSSASSIVNQVRPIRVASSNSCSSSATTTTITTYNHPHITLAHNSGPSQSRSVHYQNQKISPIPSNQIPSSIFAASRKSLCSIPETESTAEHGQGLCRRGPAPPPQLEFSLSSVGRSFFEAEGGEEAYGKSLLALKTPETPSANITPSSSSNRFSDKSFTDSRTHEYYLDVPGDDEQEFETNKNNLKMMFDVKSKMRQESYCGSWDLLEIDLDFHEVNLDPSFGVDVQEYVFMGDDDPFGVLPPEPTQPDSLHL